MALVMSLVATYFIYARVKHQFARPSTLQIVASSRALEAGTLLAAEEVTLVDWPSNLPIEGSFTKADALVGRILLSPIPAKEPIREQLLAGAGAAIGLTAKIPDGMRAVAVVTNEVNNVSGFLFPGSHVDVLVTFHGDGGKDPLTTTVLQNIEVLSTGERLQPDPSGKPQNVKVVTLLMNPGDAQKLMLASNQGTVQFVLRNGSDQVQTEQKPVLMRQLQGAAPALVPPSTPKKTVIASKPPQYEVEVFDGTKKSITSF
jgi:pilus assembly protein CpaB